MKRTGTVNGMKLYDAIKERGNVELAVSNACKDHHKDISVIKIKENPDPYVDAVIDILENETFHYSRFRTKSIHERGKLRELCYTRTFPDRIIQHAVLQIVAPIILGTCVRDTYASQKGKGIHHGSMQIRKDMKADPEGTRYALKIDVHHYFPSIDRKTLFDMLKSKLKCRRTLDILHVMIFDVPEDNGLPIGLYSSQILSTFYLSKFDHYCKEKLGIKHYYRYMDDIVVLHSNKRTLHRILRFMREKLTSYGLEVKKNWQIYPVEDRGLDFMGYVMRHGFTLIRKRTKISYIKACNRIVHAIRHHETVTSHMIASKLSYEGMLTWCESYRLKSKYNGKVDRALEFGVDAI